MYCQIKKEIWENIQQFFKHFPKKKLFGGLCNFSWLNWTPMWYMVNWSKFMHIIIFIKWTQLSGTGRTSQIGKFKRHCSEDIKNILFWQWSIHIYSWNGIGAFSIQNYIKNRRRQKQSRDRVYFIFSVFPYSAFPLCAKQLVLCFRSFLMVFVSVFSLTFIS